MADCIISKKFIEAFQTITEGDQEGFKHTENIFNSIHSFEDIGKYFKTALV